MFLLPWLGAAFTWLMTSISAILIGAFSWGLGGLIAWAGIGFATYSGFKSLFDYIFNQIQTYFNGMPLSLIQILSIARVDEAISIIFSAYATKYIIKGAWTAYKSISFLSFDK
jgi:hypothetical protein